MSGSAERLAELARLLELDADFLEACIRCGAVEERVVLEIPAPPPVELSTRLRRIQRICRSLELDAFAGSIVVELLERVERLERDLERLRGPSQDPED